MRKILFLVVAITVIAAGCTKSKENSIEGTWLRIYPSINENKRYHQEWIFKNGSLTIETTDTARANNTLKTYQTALYRISFDGIYYKYSFSNLTCTDVNGKLNDSTGYVVDTKGVSPIYSDNKEGKIAQISKDVLRVSAKNSEFFEFKKQ